MKTNPRREVTQALAGYGVGILVAFAMGYRLTIPYQITHYLEPELLETRFWESLYHLHSQPPVLNFLLGAGLWFQRAAGLSVESVLTVFQVIVGAVVVAALALLACRLIAGPRLRLLCIALVVFHPAFYMFLFDFFYTLHELALLATLAVFLDRWIQRRRPADYAAVALLGVALAYTHNLFHYLVVLAMLTWAAWTSMPAGAAPSRADRRNVLLCLFGAAALLMAWPIKNLALFGVFSYSSWSGFNVSQGIEIDRTSLDRIPRSVPAEFTDVPAVARRDKPGGELNANHYPLILESKMRRRLVAEAILNNPLLLARKVGRNYWNYVRFSGREPYFASYGTVTSQAPAAAHPWMKAYEIVVYQDFRSPQALAARGVRHFRMRPWHVSGFSLLFPAIVLAACVQVARRCRGDPDRTRLAAFLLVVVLWVFLATVLVDGNEANRIRFSTEPFVMILAFWLFSPRSGPLENRSSRLGHGQIVFNAGTGDPD